MTPVYLDHNATTPILPEVVAAMLPYLSEHFGNPSSAHAFGRRAHEAIEQARVEVAELVGVDPDEIVFTSGGTEANNLAIRGVAARLESRRHLVTSTVEHPATSVPCAFLEMNGFSVTRAPVDAEGVVNVEGVRSLLRPDTGLVTIMLAQNETGSLMPIREIAAIAHTRGALVHSDGAQAVGKIPVRARELGVDLLSIAGHKFYAPKGVGALYVRRGVAISPVVLGSVHERGLRPGTENVAAIVGLGQACKVAMRDVEEESSRVRVLRDALGQRLSSEIPGLVLNGHPRVRLPNTLNVSFPGVRGSRVLAAAPDVAASTGSACHSADERPSAVLSAMGLDGQVALGAVRLSLGRGTTKADIESAADALIRAYRQVAAR